MERLKIVKWLQYHFEDYPMYILLLKGVFCKLPMNKTVAYDYLGYPECRLVRSQVILL